MKYLYTGDLSPFAWSEARRRILVNMGRDLSAIDFVPYMNVFGRRAGNLQQKLGIGPGVWKYNRALLFAASQQRPQIMWVDKGTVVKASTLHEIKRGGAVLVNFNTDYLGGEKHFWRLHKEGIPEYDFYFTSNALDVNFLEATGVKNVIVLPLGYYGAMFRQPELTTEETVRLGASVGFIGHWEPATEELILELIHRGLPLRVRGSSWHHAKAKRRLAGTVEEGLLGQEEFVKSIVATKINLGINSTQNRNESSGRSFEIPAAGGFLLGQRTREHQAMYVEGKEAEFYGSTDELVNKARYYLEHEVEREEIAANGRRRCLSSGTSFEELMSRMVETVEQWRA
jgi:spore maturation protein CgeB